MRSLRLIARLDIKGPNLIKGINLEGLKVLGKPNQFATEYYNSGIDELIFMDVVASLYGRNQLGEIIKEATKNIFIPITVSGGIRCIEDAMKVFSFGADKIGINSAAIKNPNLINKLVDKFGSQSIILSVEAKKVKNNYWEAYCNNGREKTNLNAIEWIKAGVKRGVGEVLLTSVDNEGTKKGFDLDLFKEASKITNVPIIASGGMGRLEHILNLVEKSGVDAIAMADVLHYKKLTVEQIRSFSIQKGLNVRKF